MSLKPYNLPSITGVSEHMVWNSGDVNVDYEHIKERIRKTSIKEVVELLADLVYGQATGKICLEVLGDD